ncbi:MAG TPA: DUF4154 domain-containing protein [Bacteroidetes bacterium]|nr:DUF4154 domain-containing protein [Bacteroidota bacterium]
MEALKCLAVMLLVLLVRVNITQGQVATDESVRVAYTYQFASSISWPNESAIDTFRIHIFSANPSLLEAFESIAQKRSIKSAPVSIQAFSDISESVELLPNIVYVDNFRLTFLPRIYDQVQGLPILVISEENPRFDLSMINFFYSDRNRTNLSFELNRKNIEEQGLTISPSLLVISGSRADAAEVFKQQEERIREQQERVAQYLVQIEDLQQQIDSQSKTISKQSKNIEQKQFELANMQREIDSLNRNLDSLMFSIENQRVILASNDSVLKHQKLSLRAQSVTMREQERQIEERNAILKQQQEMVRAQQKEIEGQLAVLSEQQQQIVDQKRLLLLAVSTAVLALIVILLVFRSYKSKYRANQLLHMKNLAIEEQKNKIEMQKVEIEKQAKKLEEQNVNLESIVEQRTKDYRLAKEKAIESDKLKTSFLANMSHETRTPLNAIIGFAKLLAERGTQEDEEMSYLRIIMNSSYDLLRLINDIIDIAKIESGQIDVHSTSFNIHNELYSLNAIYTNILFSKEKQHIDLLLAEPQNCDSLMLYSDKDRILQVLKNLLDNAIKFTDEGKIEYGYKLKGEFIEFFVADTGCGIPNDQHKSIFKRFVKIQRGGEKLYSGTGLGLVISKNLVEKLGGNIWFESDTDKGTVFHFTIPYQSKGTPAARATVLSEDTISFKGKRILICEDDESSRKLLVQFCRMLNIDFVETANGEEAVACFIRDGNFDAVLLDIQMPILDGYGALKQIAKHNAKQIPIVAQTAFAMSNDAKQILNAGFSAYLAKPFLINDFSNVLKNVLKGKTQ